MMYPLYLLDSLMSMALNSRLARGSCQRMSASGLVPKALRRYTRRLLGTTSVGGIGAALGVMADLLAILGDFSLFALVGLPRLVSTASAGLRGRLPGLGTNLRRWRCYCWG